MDLDQLNTFLEVARHNSFSLAAKRCFRTQPAISAQIRALEEEIGARVFDRSGGRVSLTAAGKVFREWAMEVLEGRKRVIAALADMDHVPRGALVVGANEGTCLHVLPEVFAEFKRDYPDVSVSVARQERAKILDSVIENTVDFGIVSLPVSDRRLRVVKIHQDELVLIVPPKHPLARNAGQPAALEEIACYPLLFPKAGQTRDALEELFAEHDLKPQISMELESSELLKRFVAANVGIGFIARLNVLREVGARELVSVPLEGRPVRRDLALVYRKDKDLSRAAKAFIDIAVILTAPPDDSV
ncbi:MAG: LysR family transcriptional regulator [Acidobacteriales bacterium]|nr:LysR family transcriptional regulator [Terriglobales bacterium]